MTSTAVNFQIEAQEQACIELATFDGNLAFRAGFRLNRDEICEYPTEPHEAMLSVARTEEGLLVASYMLADGVEAMGLHAGTAIYDSLEPFNGVQVECGLQRRQVRFGMFEDPDAFTDVGLDILDRDASLVVVELELIGRAAQTVALQR